METPVRCRKLIYLLTFCFVIALSAIILLADRGRLPGLIYRLYAFPGGDKVGHALLMGGLALLLNLCFMGRRVVILGQRAPLGSALAAGFVIIEELSQLGFRNRTFSWVDLGYSLLGVVCASVIVSRIGYRRSAIGHQ
jgi:hypothetical protein